MPLVKRDGSILIVECCTFVSGLFFPVSLLISWCPEIFCLFLNARTLEDESSRIWNRTQVKYNFPALSRTDMRCSYEVYSDSFDQ